MSDPIRIPSVESVQRLYDESRSMVDLHHGTPIHRPEARTPPSVAIHQAVSIEVGTGCTSRSVAGECELFKIQFLTRTYVSATKYKWELTSNVELCFNDFIDDVPEGALLDVAQDSETNHWKIVVWTCEDV